MESKKTDAALEAELLAMGTAGADGTEDAGEDLVLKLSKPFQFGGQTYTEVDLSGLEGTTTKDLEIVSRIVSKQNAATNPALMEMTMPFCKALAQRVSGLPLEFFERLPARDGIRLKTMVTNFLYGGDGED